MFILQTNSLCIHPLGRLPASPAAVTLLPSPPHFLQLRCFLLSMFFAQAFCFSAHFQLQNCISVADHATYALCTKNQDGPGSSGSSKTCGWSNKLPQLAAPSTKSLIPVAALMCLNHYKLLNCGEDLPSYRSLPLCAPSFPDHSQLPC